MSRIKEGDYLVVSDTETEWNKMSINYQEMLEGIPIVEIQKFLRKKKLENIEKK
jgi:hypothetical protein